LGAFGQFWQARSDAHVSASAPLPDGSQTISILAGPAANGLTLDFARPVKVVSAAGASARSTEDGHGVILGDLVANQSVSLVVGDP
jgi:hypothetical protein